MTDPTTRGVDTSEYLKARSSGTWGIITLILGVLLASGAQIINALTESFGAESAWVSVAGVVLSIAGVAQKAIVDAGYIKSRTEVKRAVADSVAVARLVAERKD
jgi:hypothetical protein